MASFAIRTRAAVHQGGNGKAQKHTTENMESTNTAHLLAFFYPNDNLDHFYYLLIISHTSILHLLVSATISLSYNSSTIQLLI
jgi:hypothetical protein